MNDETVQFWRDRAACYKRLVQEHADAHKEQNREITWLRELYRAETGKEVPSRSSQ